MQIVKNARQRNIGQSRTTKMHAALRWRDNFDAKEKRPGKVKTLTVAEYLATKTN